MTNPRASLRRDQLIPVNEAVNEKEQLEKGRREKECCHPAFFSHISSHVKRQADMVGIISSFCLF
jgi:hypothetical protein